MEQKTMSYAQGKGNLNHNERKVDGSAKVRNCGDLSRREWNNVIESYDLHKKYEEVFGEVMAQYNEEQIRKGHPERCKSIDGYIDGLVKAAGGKGGKKRPLPYNEVVVQFGNHLDGCPYVYKKSKNGKILDENGEEMELWETDKYPAKVLDENGKPILSEQGKKLKELLADYYEVWKKENPRLVILGAYIHMDEKAGPHLHIDYIPVAKSKRGMALKVAKTASLEEQLTEQGIDFKNENGKTDRQHNAVKAWTERMRKLGEDVAKKYDIEVISNKSPKRKSHSIKEYGELKDDLLAKFRNSVQDASLEIEMPKTDGYYRVSTY
nr:plasmid recombination protein [Eubacterium sp.]